MASDGPSREKKHPKKDRAWSHNLQRKSVACTGGSQPFRLEQLQRSHFYQNVLPFSENTSINQSTLITVGHDQTTTIQHQSIYNYYSCNYTPVGVYTFSLVF